MCFAYLSERLEKFKSLYLQTKERKKKKWNFCCILQLCSCFSSCFTLCKAKFCGRNKNKKEIKYYFKGNKYAILLNGHNQLQSSIIEVKNEKDEDITELVKKYAGPFEDFHNMKITPKMLNNEKIIIKIFDEELVEMNEKEFNHNDIIMV